MNEQAKWHFWIDRGGTFTDVVARTPEGRIVAQKVLSENKSAYPDAALEGIRRSLGLPSDAPLPSERIATIKMGTTVATNALLERKGEPTLLVITQGLKDQLEIGYQARPDIFAKKIIKPEMLYARVVEAKERVRADGTVEQPLDAGALEAELKKAVADGITLNRHRVHALLCVSGPRAAGRRAGPLGGIYADLGQPCSVAADQDRRAAAIPRWRMPISRRSCAGTWSAWRGRWARMGSDPQGLTLASTPRSCSWPPRAA